MKKDIFIDGETGTTGLQVHEKLSKHPNINIMSVDQSKRKDISYKKEMLAKSDVTFLCLPDEISIKIGNSIIFFLMGIEGKIFFFSINRNVFCLLKFISNVAL